MPKRNSVVTLLGLGILLTSVLSIPLKIPIVEASGTIYIRANGKVSGTDKITSADNVTYKFLDNVNDEIVVYRSDIIIDGNGYKLQGNRRGTGITMYGYGMKNVTVKNMEIREFGTGIDLIWASNITVTGNIIANNSWWGGEGILVRYSPNNTISENIIANNTGAAIAMWNAAPILIDHIIIDIPSIIHLLQHGKNNQIFENTITNNNIGIYISRSSDNTILGNNMTTNNYDIWLEDSNHNTIAGNNITGNSLGGGIGIYGSSNYVSGNNVTNTFGGIGLIGTNNTAYGNNVLNCSYVGFYLRGSFNNMSENALKNNGEGLYLYSCSNNSITGNDITYNDCGIRFDYSSNNTLTENNIRNNDYGIKIDSYCYWNSIYHNNFIENTQHVYIPESIPINFWDDSYPSGGNYWSDYNGTDSDSDGVGDTQYVINENNTDRFPLMGMFHSFTVEVPPYLSNVTETVEVITNSTISDLELCAWLSSPNEYFQSGQLFLLFNVTGEDTTFGFCRMMIPNNVLNTSSYVVLINGQFVNSTVLPCSNSSHTYLYFNYTHSTHEVIITIPELPTHSVLLLSMIAILLAATVYRRNRKVK
ncbi:MAG: right-handed parallel beta-helix repeat-containing protein [Candidatus Bathyarchaeota archaeon]|nr:right-handed parallel beta-helix repeat-containing protein [Candidatus Bathyarchaeota archaeon]